jgi:hypothetical protein
VGLLNSTAVQCPTLVASKGMFLTRRMPQRLGSPAGARGGSHSPAAARSNSASLAKLAATVM